MRIVLLFSAFIAACGADSNTESAGCRDFTKFVATDVVVTDTEVHWVMTFENLEPSYVWNLTGVPAGTLEYRWRVLTYVDGDTAEPPLEASVSNVMSGDEANGAIGAFTDNVFIAPPDFVEDLVVEVDVDAETLTLKAQRAWDPRLDRLDEDTLFRFSAWHDNVYEFCDFSADDTL